MASTRRKREASPQEEYETLDRKAKQAIFAQAILKSRADYLFMEFQASPIEQGGPSPFHQKLEQIIKAAPAKIIAEHENTTKSFNSWVACFNTQIGSIAGRLSFADKDDQKAALISERLEALNNKVTELRKEHSSRANDISDDLRDELFDELSRLAA